MECLPGCELNSRDEAGARGEGSDGAKEVGQASATTIEENGGRRFAPIMAQDYRRVAEEKRTELDGSSGEQVTQRSFKAIYA